MAVLTARLPASRQSLADESILARRYGTTAWMRNRLRANRVRFRMDVNRGRPQASTLGLADRRAAIRQVCNYRYAFFCAAALPVVALISLMIARTSGNAGGVEEGALGKSFIF